jgi:hypothetical protein
MVFQPRVPVLAGVLLLAGCATSVAPSPSPVVPTQSPVAPTQSPVAPSQATPSQAPLELWPLPDDPMGLTRAAGLEPLRIESLEYHVHVHLDVFMDGRPVLVPAGIGIDIDDPAVERFEDPGGVGYGGIEQPCENPCISPLHTHDPDGVIHTESPTPTPNTLGEFLIEWNVTLPDDAKVYLDGEPYTGDVAEIQLTDMLEIAIVMGDPPSVIPSEFPPGVRV